MHRPGSHGMGVAPMVTVSNGRCALADDSPKRGDAANAQGDPLRLVLHSMEQQLDDRVGAVSDTGPSRDESTSDLIKLEETLSSAQDKAKQLVTLRLKLDEEENTGDTGTASASPADASGDTRTDSRSASQSDSLDEPRSHSESDPATSARRAPTPPRQPPLQ